MLRLKQKQMLHWHRMVFPRAFFTSWQKHQRKNQWLPFVLLAAVLSLAPQQLLQPQVGAESPERVGGG